MLIEDMQTDVKNDEVQDAGVEQGTESSAVSDKPDLSDDKNEESSIQDVNKDESDKIPAWGRERLNEELDKRHLLEKELQETKEQLNQIQFQRNSRDNENETEKELDSITQSESISKEGLKKIIGVVRKGITDELQDKDRFDSEILAESNLKSFFSENPKARQYETEIRERIKKFPTNYKKDPRLISEVYRYIRGSNIEELERQAEERGKKKAMEGKKVIVSGASETGGIHNSGKPEKYDLTNAEKEVAKDNNMTEKEYFEYKNKKRKK